MAAKKTVHVVKQKGYEGREGNYSYMYIALVLMSMYRL